jgi:hypothetical protein
MSYIVILMSFTAIFPSIGYGLIEAHRKLGWHSLKLNMYKVQRVHFKLFLLNTVLFFKSTIEKTQGYTLQFTQRVLHHYHLQ